MADLITTARAQQTKELSSVDETLLGNLISAASTTIQRYCNRNFPSASYDEDYDGEGGIELFLNAMPILTLTSVTIKEQGSTTSLDVNGILQYVNEGRLVIDPLTTEAMSYCHFPVGRQNINVVYTAGYATVPEDVQEACVEMCTVLYGATSTDGNIGLDSESLGSYSYSRSSKNDRLLFTDTIKSLLSTYILHMVE